MASVSEITVNTTLRLSDRIGIILGEDTDDRIVLAALAVTMAKRLVRMKATPEMVEVFVQEMISGAMRDLK